MKKYLLIGLIFSLFLFSFSQTPIKIPNINISFGDQTTQSQRFVTTIQIVILMTILTLLPSIVITMTSFTRIVVVLSLLRRAVGTQQIPVNQVIIGLSLFLTYFVMHPTLTHIWNEGWNPYIHNEISQQEMLKITEKYMRKFMFKYVGDKELALFVKVSHLNRPKTPDDIPTYILIPAFMISELKKAFEIGFLLFIPFLIIDIVVASILLSMGMMMLPPVTVSFPFKLLLFVLVDGWYLVVGSLLKTF